MGINPICSRCSDIGIKLMIKSQECGASSSMSGHGIPNSRWPQTRFCLVPCHCFGWQRRTIFSMSLRENARRCFLSSSASPQPAAPTQSFLGTTIGRYSPGCMTYSQHPTLGLDAGCQLIRAFSLSGAAPHTQQTQMREFTIVSNSQACRHSHRQLAKSGQAWV